MAHIKTLFVVVTKQNNTYLVWASTGGEAERIIECDAEEEVEVMHRTIRIKETSETGNLWGIVATNELENLNPLELNKFPS